MAKADTTKALQPVTTGGKQRTQFKPGQSGNPNGRPKGSKHKLSEAFVAALCEDFAEHGPAVIEAVRTQKPADYLRVVASLVPKDINLNTASLEEMSDEELLQTLDDLRAVRLLMVAAQGDDGEDDDYEPTPAPRRKSRAARKTS